MSEETIKLKVYANPAFMEELQYETITVIHSPVETRLFDKDHDGIFNVCTVEDLNLFDLSRSSNSKSVLYLPFKRLNFGDHLGYSGHNTYKIKSYTNFDDMDVQCDLIVSIHDQKNIGDVIGQRVPEDQYGYIKTFRPLRLRTYLMEYKC